jgi:hypothetical protein
VSVNFSTEELFKLSMHESAMIDAGCFAVSVMRVHHGWIYTTFDKSHGVASSVFVPILNVKGEE